jgi:hypothetical protein
MEPTEAAPVEQPNDPTASERLTEKARELTGEATTLLAGATETARAKAGNLQAHLADFLDDGAARLRSQSVGLARKADTTGGDPTGTISPPHDGGSESQAEGVVGRAASAVAPVAAERGQALAGVMEASALWLREHDLSDLEGRLTSQLQRYPVRTLAIAAALGFLTSRRGD